MRISTAILLFVVAAVSKASAQISDPPSHVPSSIPSDVPSYIPVISDELDVIPTSEGPSDSPSASPTTIPPPSSTPSATPSAVPSAAPTSSQPSVNPSAEPSTSPTDSPSVVPSSGPTEQPSVNPSVEPSTSPTDRPSVVPSSGPTGQPSASPSDQPSAVPLDQNDSYPVIESLDLKSTVPDVMDSTVIEQFENICSTQFLVKFLPLIYPAEYTDVICEVIDQNMLDGTTNNSRRTQSTSSSDLVLRTSTLAILLHVSSSVSLPLAINFDDIVVQTFETFVSEFASLLSRETVYFVVENDGESLSEPLVKEASSSSSNKITLGDYWPILAGAVGAGVALAAIMSIIHRRLRNNVNSSPLARQTSDPETALENGGVVSDHDESTGLNSLEFLPVNMSPPQKAPTASPRRRSRAPPVPIRTIDRYSHSDVESEISPGTEYGEVISLTSFREPDRFGIDSLASKSSGFSPSDGMSPRLSPPPSLDNTNTASGESTVSARSSSEASSSLEGLKIMNTTTDMMDDDQKKKPMKSLLGFGIFAKNREQEDTDGDTDVEDRGIVGVESNDDSTEAILGAASKTDAEGDDESTDSDIVSVLESLKSIERRRKTQYDASGMRKSRFRQPHSPTSESSKPPLSPQNSTFTAVSVSASALTPRLNNSGRKSPSSR